MVATARRSLSAIVRGVLEEIDEVVDDLCGIAVRQALASSRSGAGAATATRNGDSHGGLGDSNSRGSTAGWARTSRADVDGLGSGGGSKGGRLNLRVAIARAGAAVAGGIAS